MINLFGPCDIKREAFAAWPQHMQHEFALLAREKSGGDRLKPRTIAGLTGIPGKVVQQALDDGCKPFARSFSEARELEGEIIHAGRR